MFGTSGIRGIYGKEVTEELALRIACVFAKEKFVLGRDTRKSGISLLAAAANGAGGDVIDLGIVPTPTVALATRKHGCRGIMMTASHNPEEYNGLKLMENAKEIDKEMELEVVKLYRQYKTPAKKAKKMHVDNEIINDHKAMICDLVDTQAIGKRKPKVVVDSNGAATVISPALLRDLGCVVTSINDAQEGFSRPSEPNEKNLETLRNRVKRAGADFGIGHDGDGDRCIVVDEHGEMLPFDVQLAMMIDHEMEVTKKKRIVSTVESSLIIREVVANAGGEIDITPVGSTYIGDLMEKNGAIFGGEPCGEYLYQKGVHVPDGPLAAAKFAEMFSLKGNFSELRKKYRQYFMAREKFPAKNKYETIELIRSMINGKMNGKIRSDDGIRVDEEDGWLLVRASGTEPIVRLTMEYKTKERLEQRRKELIGIIQINL